MAVSSTELVSREEIFGAGGLDRTHPDLQSAPGLRVRASTRGGLAVAGAEVLVYPRGSDWWRAGWTDEQGECALSLESMPEGVGHRVVVLRDGFAPASRSIAPEAGVVHLVLDPASRIAGQVQFGGQPLRRAGILVVAEDPASPRFDRTRFYLAEDPELDRLSARTDEDGRFTIEGVRGDRAYRLYAGGHGYVAREWKASGLEGGRDALAVPVERVFGAVLRFVDEQGRDADLPATFWKAGWWRRVLAGDPSGSGEYGHTEHGVHSLDIHSPFLGLAGLDPALVEGRPISWALNLVSTQSLSVNPLRRTDRGRPPGFEEYEVSYELQALETGLSDVRIPLRCNAEGTGKLHLRFVEEGTGMELDPVLVPTPGRLVLTSLHADESEGAATQSRVSPSGNGIRDLVLDVGGGVSHILEGIPCGDYQAWYTDWRRVYESPRIGEPVLVVRISGEAVDLPLPVPLGGWIEIELEYEDGTPFEGDVLAAVGRVRGETAGAGTRSVGSKAYVSWPAPCVLRGLEAGTWQVAILLPRIDSRGGPWEFDADVVAGEATRVSRLVRQ